MPSMKKIYPSSSKITSRQYPKTRLFDENKNNKSIKNVNKLLLEIYNKYLISH
jgi:hypothetical protein